MKLTAEMEALVLEQIERHPERAIILPDWCYWKGQDQPIVYVDRLPVRLSRYLYEKVIGPLDYATVLVRRDGVPERNVNPLLFIAEPGRKRGQACPNGHAYAGNEMPDNAMGWRCRTCYLAWCEVHSQGGRNVGQINAAKTHCPAGHPYSGGNLMVLRNGRRRCRTCNNDQSRTYYESRKAS
jgi:hypothetical protein